MLSEMRTNRIQNSISRTVSSYITERGYLSYKTPNLYILYLCVE